MWRAKQKPTHQLNGFWNVKYKHMWAYAVVVACDNGNVLAFVYYVHRVFHFEQAFYGGMDGGVETHE